jgi:hypothetical protein
MRRGPGRHPSEVTIIHEGPDGDEGWYMRYNGMVRMLYNFERTRYRDSICDSESMATGLMV